MSSSTQQARRDGKFDFVIAPVPLEGAVGDLDFPKIDFRMLPPTSTELVDRHPADILREEYRDTLVPDDPPAAEQPEVLSLTLPTEHVTVVPAGRVVRGNVVGPAVVVAGHVEGKVVAQTGPVLVLPGASVEGTVGSPGMVVIAGDVVSPGVAVACGGQLVIAETGRVLGKLKYAEIAVYEGAQIRGGQ